MFVDLFSDTIFVSLLVAFYTVFIVLILGSSKQRSKGMQWLMSYRLQDEPKSRFRMLRKLMKGLRSAFSASEQEMQKKFLAAGFYNQQIAVYYMPAKYLGLCLGAGIIYWLSIEQNWALKNLFIYLGVWLVVVLIVPDAYLARRTKNLQTNISIKLPYMIDLLAVCVQTGMTIEASMAYLSKEMMSFDKDLGHMLNKTNDRIQIVGIEQALSELHSRVPTNEMRSFVMTLNQSLQYGSSIYTVLTTLSSEIREVQMLGLEEKIGKLAAKMSVPLILFVMFPIVILIAAPGIMRMMNG
ncbi:type II secretion system F family protein [Marinomonas ostreistagni]|uniref:Type II secretion system F family protein n=1 Tax=Marinomonas ostreistagni TaxID=359209 RepID=A0ABS0ZE94_9GAMM|nr:type II secretion system F family protein [Marinomonas ostreistagni]MBJ7551483.1 type II secretion system F family protein [Marinomonas ostreistagni]